MGNACCKSHEQFKSNPQPCVQPPKGTTLTTPHRLVTNRGLTSSPAVSLTDKPSLAIKGEEQHPANDAANEEDINEKIRAQEEPTRDGMPETLNHAENHAPASTPHAGYMPHAASVPHVPHARQAPHTPRRHHTPRATPHARHTPHKPHARPTPHTPHTPQPHVPVDEDTREAALHSPSGEEAGLEAGRCQDHTLARQHCSAGNEVTDEDTDDSEDATNFAAKVAQLLKTPDLAADTSLPLRLHASREVHRILCLH